MANGVKFTHHVLLLVVFAYANGQVCVQGMKNEELSKLLRHLNRSAVKTIKSENGDVIDCVDIYKQPAFDHPLLRNHTIQMKPSSDPNGMKLDNFTVKITQSWRKSGTCPKGTVPILRTQADNIHKTKFRRKSDNVRGLSDDVTITQSMHEYAVLRFQGDGFNERKYHGGSAGINKWNLIVQGPDEFSLSQIWVIAGEGDDRNTLDAGWMVNPNLYVDNQTRLFIYWTADNYTSTGCYNLKCPGFVHTNPNIAIGSDLNPVSSYNGTQFDVFLSIYKDSGNWWLQIQNSVLGYWPATLFSSLAESADTVEWGGEIINEMTSGLHTTTQMGSGHFPNEGYGKASYFRNLKVIDASNNMRDPENVDKIIIPKPACYDLTVAEDKSTSFGYYFYYGGPGQSQECQ